MLNREEIEELLELGKSLHQINMEIDALNEFGISAVNAGEMICVFSLTLETKKRHAQQRDGSVDMIESLKYLQDKMYKSFGLGSNMRETPITNELFKGDDQRFNYMLDEATLLSILQLIYIKLVKERRKIMDKLQLLQSKTNG